MGMVDGKITVLQPIVEENFLTELTTGIFSSPIIIIPHSHFYYVDTAICTIIDRCKDTVDSSCLKISEILEFNEGVGVIDFLTKKNTSSDHISPILSELVGSERPDLIIGKNIFLCKGCSHILLKDDSILASLCQYISNYERGMYNEKTTFIFVDDIPVTSIPVSLLSYALILDIPLPSDVTIGKLLSNIPLSASIPLKQQDEFKLSLIRVFQGLSQQQIVMILRSILVRTGGFLSHVAKDIAEKEKKNLLKKSDLIEVVDSDVSLDQVGGLEVLKEDIKIKARIFKNMPLTSSTAVNIPYPKGILVLGMPGCGKSMIAKAIANEFAMPLLRLDINRMMGKYVGESEANLRKALKIAEAIHPCVLWIDEVEKAFAGSSGGEGDSVVVRLMGYFLTWMQEKKQPVYIVATANDVMRPEFMRKGRFDEVYFVDFPNKIETEEILKKKIERYSKSGSLFNFSSMDEPAYLEIASAMQGGIYGGFAGSEIEAVVNCVVERAFVGYLDTAAKFQVSISMQDFLITIESMKDSIMANQKGVAEKTTNIERILALQKTYGLKLATKKYGNG